MPSLNPIVIQFMSFVSRSTSIHIIPFLLDLVCIQLQPSFLWFSTNLLCTCTRTNPLNNSAKTTENTNASGILNSNSNISDDLFTATSRIIHFGICIDLWNSVVMECPKIWKLIARVGLWLNEVLQQRTITSISAINRECQSLICNSPLSPCHKYCH